MRGARRLASHPAVGLAIGVLFCLWLLANGISHEVPIGSLTGVAVMSENGRPIPHATVTISRNSTVGGEKLASRVIETDAHGRFKASMIPAGDYNVDASAKAHSLRSVRISVAEGKPTAVQLEMTPNSPYLDLYRNQQVFTPDEQPTLEAHGFDPADSLEVTLFKIDMAAILKAGSLSQLLDSFSRYQSPGGDPAKVGKKFQAIEHKIANKDAEGTFIDNILLPTLPEGFYFVRCRLGSETAGSYLNVSKIGLVTNSTADGSLCFVADLKTGKPVAGATLQLSRGGTLTEAGKTSADGLATVSLGQAKAGTNPSDEPSDSSDSQVVVATSGPSLAVVGLSRYRKSSDRAATVYMVTDRPVYRPGDRVHFKGFVRKRSGLNYTLPAPGTVEVELRDSSDSLVQAFHLSMPATGSFAGDFDLNHEAPTGPYRLICKGYGADFSTYFAVADYRKPEFSTTVTSPKPFYTLGQRARANVRCQYYFGGPVVGAKVRATITRSEAYGAPFDAGAGAGDSSDDPDASQAAAASQSGGEYVAEVEATTDAKGMAAIDFDTSVALAGNNGRPRSPDQPPVDYVYSVTADVSEAGEKTFTGAGDVKVVQGDFALSVSSDQNFVAPGERVDLKLKTFDHVGSSPVPHRKVRVVTGTQSWSGSAMMFKPMGEYALETDSNGSATLSVDAPKPGDFAIRATVVDDNHNTIRAEDSVYVSGDALDGRPPTGKLDVTLNSKGYGVGDTAKALVQTDKAGGYALLTVETDRVVVARVVRLDSLASSFSVPVTADLSPSANVSVVSIRDKQFLHGDVNLDVSLAEHKLRVQVSADRNAYLPGDTAVYTIKTSGPNGQPMPAELSFAVVDESVFAIKEQHLSPLSAFFPTKSRLVQTNYSFSEVYLDGGDKGGASVQVRTKFVDTALWAPDVRTDARGLATVSVKLPDNLTSWRATAVGITSDAHAGVGKVSVKVAKPLTVRLELPSDLVAQDRQEITAIVNNDSGREQDVHVRLDVTGASVSGDLRQLVHVRADRPTSVQWTISTNVAGPLGVTVRAWTDGGLEDGMAKTIQIAPHGRDVVQVQSGEIRDSAELHFDLRPDADPNAGRITLSLSPSIASSVFQSLDSLIDFPYGCVEQTMSRFLPAVLVADLFKGKPFRRPDLLSRIPGLAQDGMTRLHAMQHEDGGWGWWSYDASDEFMTAYVMDGLHRAASAGFKPDPFMVENATKYALERLKHEVTLPPKDKKAVFVADLGERMRDRAYLCYALAQVGKTEQAVSALGRLDFTKAHSPALALGAMAYRQAGKIPQAEQLVQSLKGGVIGDDSTASWKEAPGSWGSESTAQALTAIATIHPEDPIVPKIVRSLMRNRDSGGWTSTRDTCFALIGLTSYLAFTKELGQTADVTVSVNGVATRTIHFDPSSIVSPDMRIEIPVSSLKSGDNVVSIHADPALRSITPRISSRPQSRIACRWW